MDKLAEFDAGPNPVDRHVGLRIRLRRKELGISQERLADTIGLTFQQVQKYERAANRVSASKLWEVARALDTTISYFYEGLGPQRDSRPRENGEQQREVYTRKETRDLIRAYYSLSERPRRRLLDLAKSLNGDAEA